MRQGYQNVQNVTGQTRAIECMRQGNWTELEEVVTPYEDGYRSTGFEPDAKRPTSQDAKSQQQQQQQQQQAHEERPRLRFPRESSWLCWSSVEQREQAIRAAERYELREYQERQQQLQRERQEKEARQRRAREQREQWRRDHQELLQQELQAIERRDAIDYEGKLPL